jgi:hypothetical protein
MHIFMTRRKLARRRGLQHCPAEGGFGRLSYTAPFEMFLTSRLNLKTVPLMAVYWFVTRAGLVLELSYPFCE